MDKPTVPFLDLVTPHVEHQDAFVEVFKDALRTGQFIGGHNVDEFERAFASYCGVKYAVGVGSGTDALRFAMMASGLVPGEAVLTVANTFIATTEAITQCGLIPIFVDIDEKTYNLDHEKLEEYLSGCEIDPKSGRPVDAKRNAVISAIIPVHLYGQSADMDMIIEAAERYNLKVFEDACQAHGAKYYSRRENKWMMAGSMGLASAFSFYPGKNLGAFGEAGAVTTDSAEIAERVRMIRDHGQKKKYYHDMEGYNGRLDSIQAGILSVKLKRLDAWNELRRKNALVYNELLGSSGDVIIPHEHSWSKGVYHLYVIRANDRDGLQKHLAENGVATGLHYPVPLHLQKAYAWMGHANGDLPVTEKLSREILSLPMYPGLGFEQQEKVADEILAFHKVELNRENIYK